MFAKGVRAAKEDASLEFFGMAAFEYPGIHEQAEVEDEDDSEEAEIFDEE